MTGPDGWRELGFGSAVCRVNIIEWQPGVYALVVWSPLVWAPPQPQLRVELFETLLRLNTEFTGQSHLALTDDDLVILTHLRPIAGLQLEEVLDALRGVLRVADRLDEPLQRLGLDLPQLDLDDPTRGRGGGGVSAVRPVSPDHFPPVDGGVGALRRQD